MLTIFTPYRICPIGAHVDHQLGRITGFALDRGVRLQYEETTDGSFSVISKNYPGIICFQLEEIPVRRYFWGDFLTGVVEILQNHYTLTKGFKGEIEGTLPVGGLSSSAAVILTYLRAVCQVNEIHLTQRELISNAVQVERSYIGVNVGKLDQSCEVYSKKDHLLFLDTQSDLIELIPQNPDMPPFEIMIAFSGVERKLAGTAYNSRVDECKAAAYALKEFSGMEYGRFQDTYLREVPRGIFETYASKLPVSWRKRASHFYAENERVLAGIQAWRKGDLETFGRQVFASGYSSIHEYQTGSEELKVMYEILCRVKGVYGGRFAGAGFNGCSLALIDPEKKEEIQDQITEQYLKRFPELKESFSIHFCQTSDGIGVDSL